MRKCSVEIKSGCWALAIRPHALVLPRLDDTPSAMKIPPPYVFARMALIWVVALALLLLPQMHALAHAAMERADEARHASLSITSHDAGHSHDDGDEDEQQPGHRHGQNTLDHSHDTPYRSENGATIAHQRGATWRTVSAQSLCLGVVFGLERPPRLLSA